LPENDSNEEYNNICYTFGPRAPFRKAVPPLICAGFSSVVGTVHKTKTHFSLDYFEHNGDDEPYEKTALISLQNIKQLVFQM